METENDFIDIIEGGGIQKKILRPGSSDEQPQKGQTVEVLYTGKLEDGTQFDSNQNREDPFSFEIGVGKVIKGWDQGVLQMKKGEKSLLKIQPQYGYGESGAGEKIPPNSVLIFEVELIDFYEKEKSKFDYTNEERRQMAFQFKNEGNDHFKKQEFQKARQLYNKALDFVEQEKGQDMVELKTTCFLNMSQACLKEALYMEAIQNASRVLEIKPDNVKALFRRGVAYMNFSSFNEANLDFQAALKLDPNNNEIKREIQNLKNKIKFTKQKEKNIFGRLFEQKYYDEQPKTDYSDPSNPVVFLDVTIGQNAVKRMEIELFNNLVPRTCENFLKLCSGEMGVGQKGKNLHFKGNKFHRLIKQFMIQGGDFTEENGTGGESIFGEKFEDENFKAKHLKRGMLSMANSGPNTNGSQFFITFKETNWLDGKHVVFGVIRNQEGMDLLDEIENVEVGANDKPNQDICIADCGILKKD